MQNYPHKLLPRTTLGKSCWNFNSRFWTVKFSIFCAYSSYDTLLTCRMFWRASDILLVQLAMLHVVQSSTLCFLSCFQSTHAWKKLFLKLGHALSAWAGHFHSMNASLSTFDWAIATHADDSIRFFVKGELSCYEFSVPSPILWETVSIGYSWFHGCFIFLRFTADLGLWCFRVCYKDTQIFDAWLSWWIRFFFMWRNYFSSNAPVINYSIAFLNTLYSLCYRRYSLCAFCCIVIWVDSNPTSIIGMSTGFFGGMNVAHVKMWYEVSSSMEIAKYTWFLPPLMVPTDAVSVNANLWIICILF